MVLKMHGIISTSLNFPRGVRKFRDSEIRITESYECICFCAYFDPVADPGFSPGGCANSQNCYYFSNFCQKLHENERIWTPRGGGGASLVPPLRSANVIYLTTRMNCSCSPVVEPLRRIAVHTSSFIQGEA